MHRNTPITAFYFTNQLHNGIMLQLEMGTSGIGGHIGRVGIGLARILVLLSGMNTFMWLCWFLDFRR